MDFAFSKFARLPQLATFQRLTSSASLCVEYSLAKPVRHKVENKAMFSLWQQCDKSSQELRWLSKFRLVTCY